MNVEQNNVFLHEALQDLRFGRNCSIASKALYTVGTAGAFTLSHGVIESISEQDVQQATLYAGGFAAAYGGALGKLFSWCSDSITSDTRERLAERLP